ncbi:MAG: alpha-galactosidase [Mediterraneibacter gnavus]
MEQLTESFPDVLFEGCSSGGGRFDAGMLYYMPQTWTSDNTDAVCRLKIQHGTSLLFPAISMGAHVSAVPNHQVGRTTSLETRYTGCSSWKSGL